ncbi:MAG: Gfo/Idh/MocA family oxidoreductase [Verrucomicrobia bacterium]|nr:Gfo/Idh/MocA family oxidoreductase [Verrucomicrobiota bacterium]
MKPIKICIVGAGQFSQCFLHLFKAHPLVSEVSLAELMPDRRKEEAARLGLARTFASLDEALTSDVDAVGLFTQRYLHAPMAIKALNAGKHVYSAVPAAVSIEELEELVATVKRTGLTYMMGETSLYYGSRVYCQEKWDAGEFGKFVYGEGEYYHDMSHGFYEAYQSSGGADWKKTASFPPMLYPTHSVSMILGTTGARATGVSCLGWADQSDDGVFDPAISLWKNNLSNQSALFRTSDGGMMRINEFRRIGQSGGRSVRLSLYGTEGSFEEQSNGGIWTTRTSKGSKDVEPLMVCGGVYSHEQWEAVKVDAALKGEFVGGFAEVHQKYRSRLPEQFKVQPNGHEGSHQFLTDDFVTSVVNNRRPTCSVWDAARFNAPGIVAHQSSLQGGTFLPVPDFGTP